MRLRKTTNKKLKKVTELTIERDSWVMGDKTEILGIAALLNEKSKMCCLGFMCHAAGLGREDIANTFYPIGTQMVIPSLTTRDDEDRLRSTGFGIQAAVVNDDSRLSNKEREKKLKTLFKEEGIKLKFTGKYPEGVK